MPFTCRKCNATFAKHQGLRAHEARLRPCDAITDHQCQHCSKKYTRADNLKRHTQICREVVAAHNQSLMARINAIEQNQAMTQASNTVTVMNMNSTVTNIQNIQNVTNVVNITPWGTPLALSDSDVETALARIPSLVGSPAMSEIVDVLMSLVKKAHSPSEARNVYLNPKRGDQALALTAEGWAAMPLSEATAALFDGASAQIAARPSRANVKQPIRTLRTIVPVQYQQGKEEAVQLGLKPMEAHLQNTRPGGPGPLLQSIEKAVIPAQNLETIEISASSMTNKDKLQDVLQRHPARYEASGAISVAWIVQASQAAGLTGQEVFKALEDAAMLGECLAEYRATQIYTKEKSVQIHPHY